MSVGDICRRDLVTIAADAGLGEAATAMREKHVGMLIVVEPGANPAERVVQGVVTDRDIVVTVMGRGAEPKDLKVGDVMTRNPLLIAEGTSVAGALGLMRTEGVRRVPVVGARNQLLGVLSLDDVLDAIANQLVTLAGAIRGGQARERTARP